MQGEGVETSKLSEYGSVCVSADGSRRGECGRMLGLVCMCESEASFTLCLQDGPLQVRLHKLAKPSEFAQHFAYRGSSRRR
jgi:hypothetical protein